MSSSTNNDGTTLTSNMKRLSLSTAIETPLPPSSPVAQRMTSNYGNDIPSSNPGSTPLKTPLRRAPSSSSIGSSERPVTPSLHKRTSLSSLHGAGGVTPPRSPAVRRTSSHFLSSPNATASARSSLPPPAEEPPRPAVTAASVAHDFFARELSRHDSGSGDVEESQTVVILQDDCYGHRYSRPRTSRANLSTIVERPERIHASILGLATAYVRLGGRHADGHAAPHPKKLPQALPPCPFRIQKTGRRLSLRSPAAAAIHGAQWMNELTEMCNAAESKLALSGKELTRPGTSEQPNGSNYLEKGKLHEGDLYLCSGSLSALEGALGGVCEGVDAVFKERGPKRAFVCIRPPGHHCSADLPSGFCWLNNVHVGIGHAMLAHGLTHAAIIDFDLHHGDGSQSITWAHNSRVASMPRNTSISKKTAIGYFSIHDINSYPCEMGDDEKVRNASLCIENAHGQSIWNVHLESWKTEAEFWKLYQDKYSVIIAKARSFLRLHSEKLRHAPTHPRPKAAIFLSAGFDASEWESPGMQRHQVNVPTSFYARLTRDVVAIAEEEGLGVDGRVISVLEGGYSDRALMSGVLSHISGLTVQNTSDSLGSEVNQKLGRMNLNGDPTNLATGGSEGPFKAYDSDWWSYPRLEQIETIINPQALPVPKKQKSETRPTYTSATQSYTAKIVSPPQGRRSFSGPGASLYQPQSSRPPSPPPPSVDWATAAHELSKLLVPSDRECRSCKPEDLNAEASRARRDRYSTIGVPISTDTAATSVSDPKRMQLRDRRGKTPQYASGDEDEKKPARSSRRKTVADVSLLTEDAQAPIQQSNLLEPEAPLRHARRRSSIASNASSVMAERGSDTSLGSATDMQLKQGPLTLKKSRFPASSRAEASKPKIVKKQPTVPRFPSNSSTTSTLENHQPPPTFIHEVEKAPLSELEKSTKKDVDQLAAGMRTMSIKLNVPPREEYEARQSKSKAAPRGRPPKSTGKVASPTKAKVKAAKNLPPKSLPAEPLIIQQLPPPAIAAGLGQESTGTASPTSALLLQPAALETTANVPSSTPFPLHPVTSLHEPAPNADEPIQHNLYRDNGDQKETSEPVFQASGKNQPQSPEIFPPSTPVTVRRTKQDLPVFTSTSPISFGKSSFPDPSIGQAMSQDPAALSYADANPLTAKSNLSGTDDLVIPPKTAPNVSPPMLERATKTRSTKETANESSASIWDVPDTPQPQRM